MSRNRTIVKVLNVFLFLFFFTFGLSISSRCWAVQVTFELQTEPERLIPIKVKNPQTYPISMQIFQGLVDLNERGEIIPSIIEKFDTKDYKTWVLHVRKGIHFHESKIFSQGTRELTADDVVYSLTRFCSADAYQAFLLLDSVKGAKEYNEGKAQRVEGIRRVDRYTLEVELIRAEPFFLHRLSTPWIVVFPPESEKAEFADQMGLSMAVGTGPYFLVSRTETEIILNKNKTYWDKQNSPQIDSIVYRVIKNDQVRIANLQRGDIDIFILPNNLFPSVFNRDGSLRDYVKSRYQVKVAPTYNTHFIGFNTEMIPDVNLRQAMIWATNRKEIVDNVLYGYGDVMYGAIPEGMNGYQPPFTKEELFDIDRARSFLKKSSYKGEPLELWVHELDNSEQVSQIFQAQMANLGIQITLKKIDFNSATNRMVKGQCPLFSNFFPYLLSSPEPLLINLFHSSKIPAPNFFHIVDPKIDEMLGKFYGLTPAESILFSRDVERRVMENAPAIFLYRQHYVLLYPNTMEGLEISGTNHIFMEKLRLKRK
jgi:peptide/nickel transport system substrate-binding protein/oligopeptide transport system substrate-binding protein